MSQSFTKITSGTNPTIKILRSLGRKKIRGETGLFMAEGGRLVRQGLDAGWQADWIVITEDGLTRPHIRELAKSAVKSGTRVAQVPARLLSQITGKTNAGGVAAAFQQKCFGLDDFSRSNTGTWIALYEVRDPGNLGTILRTADCAGASGVVLIGKCCDPYSIEAVRASMGAVFDIPFVGSDVDRFDTWRKSRGLRLVAASVNGRKRHDQIDYGSSTVILMGNEQSGIPDTLEEICDDLALIPMRPGADSLNLAQATTLMAYEAWRSRDFAGLAEPR